MEYLITTPEDLRVALEHLMHKGDTLYLLGERVAVVKSSGDDAASAGVPATPQEN